MLNTCSAIARLTHLPLPKTTPSLVSDQHIAYCQLVTKEPLVFHLPNWLIFPQFRNRLNGTLTFSTPEAQQNISPLSRP